jgi:hypothetical protein
MKGTFTSTRSIPLSNTTKLRAAIATAFAVIAVGGSVITTAGATSESSGNQLAGTWNVTVTRPAPLPAVSSLQVYTAQGSMVESGSDGVSRSPQYASWKRIGGREYAATGIFFRFDPQTGAFVGRMKINRTIELAEDGQSFTFRGSSTILDANGHVVVSVSASGSGQRLQVEEQP